MIYWLCLPSSRSRNLITLAAILFIFLLAAGSYSHWQILSVVCLVGYMTQRLLRHHRTLPLAISNINEDWRCYYADEIRSYTLKRGFVLGPIALIDLTELTDAGHSDSLRLFLMRWDINQKIQTSSANWRQLATMLKYAKGPQQQPLWLSNQLFSNLPRRSGTETKHWLFKNGL